MTGDAGRVIRAGLWLTPGGIVRGYAADPADPASCLVVEILADGLPVALLRAEEASGIGAGAPEGDGFCGFSVRLDPELLARTRRLVARLANGDAAIAVLEVDDVCPAAAPEPVGAVRWGGGLRLTGHVTREGETEPVPVVKALVDGTEVARAACRDWVQRDHGRVARAFDLHLPREFADGRVRDVEVVTDAGLALPGSPCPVVAFPDPLADWIDGWAEVRSETLRARFADSLLPQSVPFTELEGWLARFPPPPAAGAPVPPRVAVVVVGDLGRDATLASLDAQEGVDWSAAALPAEATPVGFDPRQLRAFLDEEAADCPFVVVSVSGTVFAPGALALLHEAAARFPEAAAAYPDLLTAGEDGRRWPLPLPAFDPELFLERGYCALVYGLRRAAARDALDRCCSLYGLFPFAEGAPPSAAPVHLPVPLATLPALPAAGLETALLAATRARLAAWGTGGRVTPGAGALPSVRVRRAPRPGGVSVVMVARDDGPALLRTLASLDATRGAVELSVTVCHHGSTDPALRDALREAERRGHAVFDGPGLRSAARLLAGAAAAARAETLLILEPGVAAAEAGWIDEMLGRCAGRGVGAVAGLVAWDTGVIRDAGLALGPRCSAVARFTDRVVGDEGPAGVLLAAHEVSAVSAACLMTPRRLFQALGGVDGRAFPRHLYAADYAMRLREAGHRVVLTPHARLRFPSGRGASPDPTRPDPAAAREAELFRRRWSVAPGCDPFYSPWMAMDGAPHSGLAWPPGPVAARQPGRPSARPLPPGV